MKWECDILMEKEITVDQISDYKREYHKNMLADWIAHYKLDFNLKTLWQIRQSCIRALQTIN
jgi:hypothetical protein